MPKQKQFATAIVTVGSGSIFQREDQTPVPQTLQRDVSSEVRERVVVRREARRQGRRHCARARIRNVDDVWELRMVTSSVLGRRSRGVERAPRVGARSRVASIRGVRGVVAAREKFIYRTFREYLHT